MNARIFAQGLRLPVKRKFLLAEALTLIVVTRVIAAIVPLRLLTPLYGHLRQNNNESPEEGEPYSQRSIPIPEYKAERIRQVQWALRVAKVHLPYAGTCLPRALAGSVMLRRRGLPATIRIGACHNSDQVLKLHAWLTSFEDISITGVRESRAFKVLATYQATTNKHTALHSLDDGPEP